MYIPKHFQVTDYETLQAFVRSNNFATLVGVVDGALFATHLPLLLDVDAEGRATLSGHIARANPHRRAFDGAQEALAIFHGPHAYVSPRWYEESPAVPTWNYATVHAYGVPRLVEDEAWLSSLVDRLTAFHDPEHDLDLPLDFKAGLLRGIVGFQMPVLKLEGKYKLSQNRSEADRRGVIDALGSNDIASMMRRQLEGRE